MMDSNSLVLKGRKRRLRISGYRAGSVNVGLMV